MSLVGEAIERTAGPATLSTRFEIRAWAACAPGLHSQQDWLAWADAPYLPEGDAIPAVSAMAPMVRRRLGSLGRATLHCAYGIRRADANTPLIFASRHGETTRIRPMLSDLAVGNPLSPTAFGLAVHNAIGALYSIDRGDTGVMQAIAAGRDTVESSLVEAIGLLADGHEEVAVIVGEAPLDETYRDFVDEPECLYAWGWQIGLPGSGAPVFSLTPCSPGRDGESPAASLPHGLEVLKFVLSGQRELLHRSDRLSWLWRRHD
ncbi:MAG: beta-ketoacyl synthase chain length factor [Cupriavidus sp.]|nr:beta-ketoacyl synthase chain length factor [Cupriavidus sp.]